MDYRVLGVARHQTEVSDFHFHLLSKFEVYSTVLLIRVMLFYIRSPELVQLA